MSWDSFIDFIKEQEAMGVNVTFSSSDNDDKILRLYRENKDDGILAWISYLRNGFDEFEDDNTMEVLTSLTVNDFIEEYDVEELIGCLAAYPDLHDMLFKESKHVSTKFFLKLVELGDVERFKYYLEETCYNENIRYSDEEDGFERLLESIAERMWEAEQDNYTKFADEIESYTKVISDFSAAAVRFSLANNNDALSDNKKKAVYIKCFETIKNNISSQEELSYSHQIIIQDCITSLISIDFNLGCKAWYDVMNIFNGEHANCHLEEAICNYIPSTISRDHSVDTLLNIVEDNENIYKRIISEGSFVPYDLFTALYEEYSSELFIKYFYPILKNVKFTSNDSGYYLENLLTYLAETRPADRRSYTVLQTVLNMLSEKSRNDILDKVGKLKQPKIKVSKTHKEISKRKEAEPDSKIAIDMLRKKMAESKEYFALSRIIKEDEIREALREYKEDNELETIDIVRGKRNADRDDFFDFLMGIYFAKNVLDNNDNDIDFNKYDRSSDSYKDEAETYLEELSEYEDLGIDIEDLDNFDDVDGLSIDLDDYDIDSDDYDFDSHDSDDFDFDDYDRDDFSSDDYDRNEFSVDDYDRDEFSSDYDGYDSGLSFDFDSGGFGDGDY